MKYALIIGNDSYSDPKLAQLKTPSVDSGALANVLGDEKIGDFDEVTPLVNQTETEIRRAVSSFLANKKPDDLVLVYFSGHGVLDSRGRLFLALKDTQTSILTATAIPSSFIADELDNCRSKRQILILDCCHSGAFARGIKGGEQKAVTEATFEGSGFGRVVLTASDSTQFALEGDQVISQTELSLFTHFLLEGLVTGEADINNDGYISLDEWYDYTYSQVLSTTSSQVPHKWSYRQQGDLIVAKNPFVKKKAVELSADLVRLLESPYSSARETAVKELAILLGSHDSETAKLARASLEKLKADDSRAVSLAAIQVLSEADKPVAEVPVQETKPQITPEKKKALEPAKAETPRAEQPKEAGLRTSEAIKPQVERNIIQSEKPAPANVSRFSSLKIGIAIIALLGFTGMICVALIATTPMLKNLFLAKPAPTAFSAPTQAISTATGEALLPTESPPSLSFTSTPSPNEITDAKNVLMRLVPAGEFMMGTSTDTGLAICQKYSSNCDRGGYTDEEPPHTVSLNDYYIDVYEVTNALYAACEKEGACQTPTNTGSNTRSSYYGNPEFDNFPVVYVDWNMAKSYCEWRGARLPTEAEWEKAARGTDERTFPWGEEVNTSFANFNNDIGDTTAVGSYESGKSPNGIYDIAGNVWEWVADFYSGTYYLNSPLSNPLGPDSGQGRVLRGGSWYDTADLVRTTIRLLEPNPVDNNFGFRCASDATP